MPPVVVAELVILVRQIECLGHLRAREDIKRRRAKLVDARRVTLKLAPKPVELGEQVPPVIQPAIVDARH